MTIEKKLRIIDRVSLILILWWMFSSWFYRFSWVSFLCAGAAFALKVWSRTMQAKAIKSGEIPPPPEVDLKPYFGRLLALAAVTCFGMPLVEFFFTSQRRPIGEILVMGAVLFLILGVTFWAATHPEKARR